MRSKDPLKNTGLLSNIVSSTIAFGVFGGYLWFTCYAKQAYDASMQAGSTHPPALVDLWTPIFLGSIVVELLICIALKRSDIYSSTDFFSSVGSGVFDRLLEKSLFSFISFYPYSYIYNNWYVYRLTDSWSTFLLAMVVYDFFYYWLHRTSHTIAAAWAAHSVHHSSEMYNLGTALRQSFGQSVITPIYQWPMALFLSPVLCQVHGQFSSLYQFWIHTPLVGKLGVVEWIMNTPSQHRVHHARNAVYVDKNYSGIFSVWDRLFGTFQEELTTEPPVYGVIGPVNSFEPAAIQLIPFARLFSSMSWKYSFMDNVRILWEKPGWIVGSNPPKEKPIPPVDRVQYFSPSIPAVMQIYVVLHFTVCLGLYAAPEILASSNTLLLIASLFSLGQLANRYRFAVHVELARLSALVLCSCMYVSRPLLTEALAALAAVSAVVIFMCRKQITVPLTKSELGFNVKE